MIATPFLLACSPLVLGAGATLIFGRRLRKPPVPGLLFHSVVPKPRAEMAHFPRGRFEKLCDALQQRNYRTLTLHEASNASALPPGEKTVLLTFDDGLQSVYRHALPLLDGCGFRATVFCVSGFYGEDSSWDIFPHNRHLTREEIRSIAQSGHEIGSHTCTHAYLPYLDDQSVRRELSNSKKLLENIIGKAVTSLSFPYGGWNQRIWEIAQETGYTAATLYRGHVGVLKGLFPVQGVHRFDSVDDVLAKLTTTRPLSLVRARSRMMTHFARGTPVWKYRKEYVKV
ncbi:MAG: polysaccharide deacetylase family protein [Chitinispirillaceae bacterium]|nr:polysaccharide deacetylase family protein [Chitinispirillaceae bacterium]